MPTTSEDRHTLNLSQLEADNSNRMIDGLLYPRPERNIDQLGFETTKHALRFHGADWDIVLIKRRDELTKNFIHDAALATGEPEENIQNLRFVVNGLHLFTKFTVRHKIAVTLREIQTKLAKSRWESVRSLYEPREKKPRKPKRQNSNVNSEQRQLTLHNLSFYGRVNVGPEGPEFIDDHDPDEEPPAYEEMEAARAAQTRRTLPVPLGIAGA